MKNSLEVFKGRFEWTKKSLTSKLRDRVMEIIKSKKQNKVN